MKRVICLLNPCSQTGIIPINSLSTLISNGKYVLAISTKTNPSSLVDYHATVCIGLVYVSSATIVEMFDPHGSHKYVNYSNPIYTTNSNTYIWNSGYYSKLY